MYYRSRGCLTLSMRAVFLRPQVSSSCLVVMFLPFPVKPFLGVVWGFSGGSNTHLQFVWELQTLLQRQDGSFYVFIRADSTNKNNKSLFYNGDMKAGRNVAGLLENQLAFIFRTAQWTWGWISHPQLNGGSSTGFSFSAEIKMHQVWFKQELWRRPTSPIMPCSTE